jgi:hypothetical protein
VKRIRRKRNNTDIEEQLEQRLRAQHPELGAVFDSIKGTDYATSLVDNKWYPTPKEYNKEINRI